MCPLFYFYYHLTRSGIFVIFHYPEARKRQHGDCHNVTIPPVWQCKTGRTAAWNVPFGPFCNALWHRAHSHRAFVRLYYRARQPQAMPTPPHHTAWPASKRPRRFWAGHICRTGNKPACIRPHSTSRNATAIVRYDEQAHNWHIF